MIKITKDYNVIPDCIDGEDIEDKIEKIVSNKILFSWKDIDGYDKLKSSLMELYNCKCAFCEQKITPKDLRIIHFRPYKGKDTCKAYQSLAYEWSNLLLVCNRCKQLKGDKFSVTNKNPKDKQSYKDRILLKDNQERLPDKEPLKHEIPKLLNPEFDILESRFAFKPNGKMQHKDGRGLDTIVELELNNKFLCIKRKKQIDLIFKYMSWISFGFHVKILSKESYLSLLNTYFKELFLYRGAEYPFSAYNSYVFDNFNTFVKSKIRIDRVCDEIIHAFEEYKKKEKKQLQDNNNKENNMSKKKKKILIIESQPNNLTDTEANNGISGIVEAWKSSINREVFEEPKIKLATNKTKLLQILHEELPDIVHFSLHTDKAQGLIFRDREGNKDYMDKLEFKDTINNFSLKKHLDLVFVNSCNSSVYIEEIKSHIDYAIGMTDLIPPEVANLFATKFYENLFTTKSVEDAFNVGKHALKHDKTLALPENIDIPKHKIPKLYKQ